ncbi:hypothetical protein [Tumebacillus permanentifrigoris]|uniref:Uncharacterized protein n=1 Tax=Tumebacillus permanentifrigoris TaxID=378543 RepID=A0A316DCV2_9BACL|nr:hypothetical protein [Tumebacillus permanentifrigoris]PWK13145.1 hypothetical protein C7459_108165 [Tumebacillus permanentifrigoris]
MTVLYTLGGCVGIAAIAFLVTYLCWGLNPWLQARAIQSIRRRERVRMVADVNTNLDGYVVTPNSVTQGVTVALWVLWTVVLYDQPILIEMGVFAAVVVLGRDRYVRAKWQKVQSYLLTDKSLYVFPARTGRAVWQGKRMESKRWTEFDCYRFDGGYVQLFHAEEKLFQFEFNARDIDKLRSLFSDLNVARGELSDRIWLGQFEEEAFYLLEDEMTELGWNLIDLYRPELQELGLHAEFGVMRNVAGDRLREEYARSWLQLNLVDEEGVQQISSLLPLWQSSGNIGNLIGVRGQDAIDHLQKWMSGVLREVQEQREEVVVS